MSANTETPHLPPQDLEAEQAVLGAILLDNKSLTKAKEVLSVEDFSSTLNQKIYQAMLDLSEHGGVIDSITLANHLKTRGELEAVGGAAYLAELVQATPSAANIRSHCKIVRDTARIRQLRDGLYRTSQAADNEADIEHLKEQIHRLDAIASTPTDGPGSYGLTRVADVVARPIQWLWLGRIPRGKLTVLDGDPGLGKSLITLDLAARVSMGGPMPDGTLGHLGGPRGVVLLSAEDDASDTIRPRLDGAGADLARVMILSYISGRNGAPRPPHLGDLEALRSAIQTTDAALVVIDPLMAFIPDERDTHRDQDIRRLLAPLAKLAADTGAAVLVVRHLNKGRDGNPLYRGGGSIGIVGAARSGLLVATDPEDSEGHARVLAPTKCNLAAPVPSLRYRVVEARPDTASIEWLGESPQTAANLLSAASEDRETRTECDEAVGWLRAMLADGPVPAKKLLQEADAAGHAKATIRRARRRLDVLSEKEGYQGQWVWSLPKGAHPNRVSTFAKPEAETSSNPAKFPKGAHALKGAHLEEGKASEHLWSGGNGEVLDL